VLLRPSEFSVQQVACRVFRTRRASSLGVSFRREVRTTGPYRRYWLGDPAVLLAIPSALRSSESGSRRESPKGTSPELLPFQPSSRVLSLLALARRRSPWLLSWTSCSLRH